MLHIPTGLFYKPVKGYDSNLGLSGKVYSRRPQLPGCVRIHLRGGELSKSKEGTVAHTLQKHFKLKGGYVDTYFKVPDSEWQIIEY